MRKRSKNMRLSEEVMAEADEIRFQALLPEGFTEADVVEALEQVSISFERDFIPNYSGDPPIYQISFNPISWIFKEEKEPYKNDKNGFYIRYGDGVLYWIRWDGFEMYRIIE